ncbi:pyridoxal phosphate-dependent decarboxylase family protein [Amycolatopsis anabasis]|uniref:pyridoxal phosphate-dependent decarboxylase family protein n=1 Tax=Amycolatopsis anabasis TaxID=1840409 RepID=UPI00131E187D|nr:pyridoxal-dependent decarboxylase [Amycolatopsis anabasis]
MHPKLAADLGRLPQLLDATRDLAAAALAGVESRPVATRSDAPARVPLPVDGSGAEGALAWFAQRWQPGFSASAGPRYLGFVTGGATPASIAGDWLTSVFDQNAASPGGSSAAELEHETLGWLAELLELGDAHSGAFVTGATTANFAGLAIGREWLGERRGVSVAQAGAGALGHVEVLSGTPHSSVHKALSMLGLGRDSLHPVPTPPGRESVDLAALAERLDALAGRPAIVVANAGTVNTVDFDDLAAIAELRRRYPFWLHVDGAFGAFAGLSAEHADRVRGLAEADSICVDLHKWLNVPYDAAVVFTRRRDLQVRVFQNAAAYLGRPGDDPDFLHLVPENSRRLRALATWFTLAAYGRSGHRDIVERTIACARKLGAVVDRLPGLRLLAPVRLNVVCFTVEGDPAEDRVAEVVRKVAESGAAFVTPTVYDGIPAIRAAFSNWRTTEADVDVIAETLRAAAQ